MRTWDRVQLAGQIARDLRILLEERPLPAIPRSAGEAAPQAPAAKAPPLRRLPLFLLRQSLRAYGMSGTWARLRGFCSLALLCLRALRGSPCNPRRSR